MDDFENAGLKFLAEDETGDRLEILELPCNFFKVILFITTHAIFCH